MTRGLFLLAALLPLVVGKNCHNSPDGVYDLGCKSFVKCVNGVAYLEDCGANEVYDKTTHSCRIRSQVPGVCGLNIDCTSKQDGSYPDTAPSFHCHSYFTCRGGTFFGHNFCPGGTVFSTQLQTCDWPDDVPPPCGSKTT